MLELLADPNAWAALVALTALRLARRRRGG